jgi:ActD protein
MAGKNTAVFGIYGSQTEAERAVAALQAAGFRNTDISVLFPENEGTKDFAHEKGTKAPEGATTGAGTGAAVGGTLGWLAGIGALAIPGLGPFIAAGPIMAALAGAGVGGAVGGLTGALIGMGIPEYEAKRYEGRVKKGGILLSVHSDNSKWTDRAKKLLEETGAQDIASASEKKGDFDNTNKPMPRSAGVTDAELRERVREDERDRERVVARGDSVDAIVVDDRDIPLRDRSRYPKGE